MSNKSTVEPPDKAAMPVPLSVSRRTFLAGMAACVAARPTLLRAAKGEPGQEAILHLANRVSQNGHVHTFALTSEGCTLLGSTAVDSLATLAAHPVLPVLYVARDCRQWEDLPRGVIETYAVERDRQPLRLLARTTMALSATGPRSLAISSCGWHLLVSASTGGAWNAFALDRDGVPASVAIARKEIGTLLNSHTVSLPTPHGLAFSPHGSLAVGTDPGSERMTLLQPSSHGIVVLARCQTPHGLTAAHPVWTADGKYIIVANARSASLSLYALSKEGGNAEFRLICSAPTATPVTTLLAHPVESAVFTSRRQDGGSRLELWKVDGSHLRLASDTWVSGDIVALARHANGLWAVSQDRLLRIPIDGLRTPWPFEMPLPLRLVQAVVIQTLAAHHLAPAPLWTPISSQELSEPSHPKRY